jgi:pyruvate/2-oxoglutarate dehydrogenase complex dihydrolipoamide acyltransferase (E2) component
MFGITKFSAVINPPQIGILAVGSSQLKFNSEMKPETNLSFSLSFDERCVSMDRAIKFLNALSYFISNPALMNEPTQF